MSPDLNELNRWFDSSDQWLVLTGAGCSTAAGLGDYRDKNGQWKRSQPIHGQPFRNNPVVRQRYWARSAIGWPPFSKAQPTKCHRALRTLQVSGRAPHLITQNVDQLHQKATHQEVIDLHGALANVVCLQCGELSKRDDMQHRLLAQNPWLTTLDANFAPDGDADLELQSVQALKVPSCLNCAGMLKPDLLVVGSSLMVYSSYRFCRHAKQSNKPIVIVNDGVTRADDIASAKISGDCGEVLEALVSSL